MENHKSSRRKFVGSLAAGAGILASIPQTAIADSKVIHTSGNDADAWFNKVKGSHRIVYDATEPHAGYAGPTAQRVVLAQCLA